MIVDANLVIYWFCPSEFEGSVARFYGRPDLLAPSILLVETANALYKNARGGLIRPELCTSSITLIEKTIQFVPDRDLLSIAIDVALSKLHPVYDCLYLALALQRQQPLATADRRMATLAQTLGITVELILPDQQDPSP